MVGNEEREREGVRQQMKDKERGFPCVGLLPLVKAGFVQGAGMKYEEKERKGVRKQVI
jgi:hypothetical protein